MLYNFPTEKSKRLLEKVDFFIEKTKDKELKNLLVSCREYVYFKGKEGVGETYKTNEGYYVRVLKYVDAKNIIIQFEDGFTTTTTRQHLYKGQIRNPNHKSTYNVGYFGWGNYSSISHRKIYLSWSNMMKRCYDDKSFPTYKDVTICEEWHNFQNFAAWFEKNYVEGYYLNKSIKQPNSKTYSPETCCFVPFLLNCKVNSNKLPNVRKVGNKFLAHAGKDGKLQHIGSFDKEEDAINAVIKFKKEYIIKTAEEFKKEIPIEIYNCLINYEFNLKK